jgi:hypothetical protein
MGIATEELYAGEPPPAVLLPSSSRKFHASKLDHIPNPLELSSRLSTN